MTKSTRRSTGRRIGAVAAMLVTAVFAAGCGSSAYARRTAEDARLGALVEARLAESPALAAAHVEAKSYSGVVALLGEAPDEGVSRQAEETAARVPGVVRVNNLILVVKGASRAAGSAPAKGTLVIARAD